MASREEVTLPATRPKSRKSLAHIPSSQSIDQENMTADIGALTGKKALPIEKPSRKSRSKSIGPGGLDALKDTTGNRRKVRECNLFHSNRTQIYTETVSSYYSSSSTKVHSQTHHASTTRNSGAYINAQESQEDNPAICPQNGEFDRLRCGYTWRNSIWSRKACEPFRSIW